MRKDFLNKEQFDNAITVIVIVFCFTFLWWASWIFRGSVTIVTQIITAVIGALGVVIGFRWGNSRNSNRKDETIDQLLTPSPGSTTVTTTQNNNDETK